LITFQKFEKEKEYTLIKTILNALLYVLLVMFCLYLIHIFNDKLKTFLDKVFQKENTKLIYIKKEKSFSNELNSELLHVKKIMDEIIINKLDELILKDIEKVALENIRKKLFF